MVVAFKELLADSQVALQNLLLADVVCFKVSFFLKVSTEQSWLEHNWC